MDSYHNKKDVVNQFGLPTEKRTGEGIEEWIYDRGTVSTGTGISSNGRISVGVAQYNTYSKYIKFTFDKDGNVIKWDSPGIDLSVKKTSVGKGALLILGMVAVAVLLGIALSPHGNG